jgi:hypothetical protein
MRRERPNMIQSVEQYVFVHRAIAEFYVPPKEEEKLRKPTNSHYQKFADIKSVVDIEPDEYN